MESQIISDQTKLKVSGNLNAYAKTSIGYYTQLTKSELKFIPGIESSLFDRKVTHFNKS